MKRASSGKTRVQGRPSIEGLALDFDGTLYESEWAWFSAWQKGFAEFGLVLSARRWRAGLQQLWGNDLAEVLDGDLRSAGLPPLSLQARRDLIDRTTISASEEGFIRPDVERLAFSAIDRGLPIGIVTDSSAQWVTHHLRKHSPRLNAYFGSHPQRLVTPELPGVNRKPCSSGYRRLADVFAMPTHSILGVEDTRLGLRAAATAGLFAVAAPNRLSRGECFDTYNHKAAGPMPALDDLETVVGNRPVMHRALERHAALQGLL